MSLLHNNRLILITVLLSACLLLFTGCTSASGSQDALQEPEPVEETSVPEPSEEPPEEIIIGDFSFFSNDETIDLSGAEIDFEALCAAAPKFEDLRSITLGITGATAEQLHLLLTAFPDAEITWSVSLLDTVYPSTVEVVDLSGITDEYAEEASLGLTKLPYLHTVQLCTGDELTRLSIESINAISEAAPDADINCRFELYGLKADWTTEELRYVKTNIGDAGIDVFRSVLPYLRSLTLLRLERCGIKDYESMAELKNDFPDKNIVWSVLFAGYDFMTDTTLMNSPMIRDNNAYLLKYFPDVLYLDVGHNRAITNIDFVKYFPKLTTVILSITKISDISPLANCPDIEFLECFSTNVGDISCLSQLKKLEYLNLGDNKNLSDLTPLYELENLKIVRLCQRSFDHLSKDDAKELQAHLPNCFVSYVGGHSANSGNWRYNDDGSLTDRYALLKEQMRYHLMWQDRQTNSPSGEE